MPRKPAQPKWIWYDSIGFVKKNNGYYYTKVDEKPVFLHRYIYEKETGKTIPEGFQIHHIDGNHYNNDISNLVMVEQEIHYAYHRNKRKEDLEKKWEKNRTIPFGPPDDCKELREWVCIVCGKKMSANREPSERDKICSDECDAKRRNAKRMSGSI
jgi:hypothetical protein